MKKNSWLVLLSLCFAMQVFATKTEINLVFYAENLSIKYNTDLLAISCSHIDEKSIVRFYRFLETKDYQTLLSDLLQKKQQLQLNDWLFYQLMRQSIAEIFYKKSRAEQELLAWFLLSQAGFDTRLTYLAQRVHVYVYSTDEIFEVPMIEDKNRTYVNLSNSPPNTPGKQEALYLLNFLAQPTGKAFSFYLKTLPKLTTNNSETSLQFIYGNTPIRMDIAYDKTVIAVMEHYPLIAEEEYLNIPMSETLKNSLLPQFRELLKEKTLQQSLELLLAFTRSSFEYKEDKEYFGKSKPMIADELFFYPFSDCEDRTVLFFILVKELLDLPMIIVAFPDHLTVAVALEEELPGAVLQYNGKRYYICDPTGPVNSSEIGVFPKSYENSEFEIIIHYK